MASSSISVPAGGPSDVGLWVLGYIAMTYRTDISVAQATGGGKRTQIVIVPRSAPGGTLVTMSFGHSALRGFPVTGTGGRVEYRLARNAVVSEFHKGRLSKLDVCDAHPELMRAARNVGVALPEECPICEGPPLVHVTYVFGPRLPSNGRCPATADRAGPPVPAGRRGRLLRRRGLPRLCLEPPGPDVSGRRPAPGVGLGRPASQRLRRGPGQTSAGGVSQGARRIGAPTIGCAMVHH